MIKPTKQEMQILYAVDARSDIERALATLRVNKPDDRTQIDRAYAVTITMIEQAFAYFMTFVVNAVDDVKNEARKIYESAPPDPEFGKAEW